MSMPLLTGVEAIRRNWGWFLVLGILLIILGTVAIGIPWLMTLASVLFFGWLMLVGGILEAVHAFWSRRWSGFFLHLLIGVLDAIIGLLIITKPAASAVVITMILAAFLVAGGLLRSTAAVSLRFPNWGWSLFGGLLSLALGILLWVEWPVTGLWFIGFCIGLNLIFRGWGMVMFALAIRSILPPPGAPAP